MGLLNVAHISRMKLMYDVESEMLNAMACGVPLSAIRASAPEQVIDGFTLHYTMSWGFC